MDNLDELNLQGISQRGKTANPKGYMLYDSICIANGQNDKSIEIETNVSDC